LGFEQPGTARQLWTLGILALVTAVPLVLLTFPFGLLLGNRVQVPLLHDPGFYSRYVVVLPLLVFSEAIVATSLAVQTGYFLESGLVPQKELPRFESAELELKRFYHSWTAAVVIGILSFTLAIVFRAVIGYRPGSSSWFRLPGASGDRVTFAGWWATIVSVPVVVFLLLRWFWRACVWDWFLYRVSRLDLELTPTHPDRAGGLGFLAWGQAAFAPVLAAVSAILSGSMASEVLYANESLNSLKYHIGIFVALSLIFLLAPLFLFSHRLAHSRFQAILDFGMLVWRHDRAFDAKWVQTQGPNQDKILGSPDVSSLADIAAAFEHVQHMRVIPLDHQAVLVLVMAAVIPLLPFLATAVPLADVLKDLAEFLV
jgi:hypothetical protein